MNHSIIKHTLFDRDFPENEQLPRLFEVSFDQYFDDNGKRVCIKIDEKLVGDCLTDNSYDDDGYRFHDVFHFSYVAVLGWSPCVRKMLGKKRKSKPKIDEVEDGARAIIAEEAVSLVVHTFAQDKDLFVNSERIDSEILEMVTKLVSNFEVRSRSRSRWEKAILEGYSAYRHLLQHQGGTIRVDMTNRKISVV